MWRGVTVGGEIGSFRFVEPNSRSILLTTVNVGYQFGKRTRTGKVNPFVEYALLGLGIGAGEYAPAGYLSGGVNYWFKPRVGLRTEFRVYGIGEEAIAMFRVGITFR